MWSRSSSPILNSHDRYDVETAGGDLYHYLPDNLKSATSGNVGGARQFGHRTTPQPNLKRERFGLRWQSAASTPLSLGCSPIDLYVAGNPRLALPLALR